MLDLAVTTQTVRGVDGSAVRLGAAGQSSRR
jgi:hypothetical protein